MKKNIFLLALLLFIGFILTVIWKIFFNYEYVNNKVSLNGFSVRILNLKKKQGDCLILSEHKNSSDYYIEFRPLIKFVTDSSKMVNMGHFASGTDGAIDSIINLKITGRTKNKKDFITIL